MLALVPLILYTDCIDPCAVEEPVNKGKNFCWLCHICVAFKCEESGWSADEADRKKIECFQCHHGSFCSMSWIQYNPIDPTRAFEQKVVL